jgi:hypothetical protein
LEQEVNLRFKRQSFTSTNKPVLILPPKFKIIVSPKALP